MMICALKTFDFFPVFGNARDRSLVIRGHLLALSALIRPDVAVDLSDNPSKKSGVEVFSKSISAVIGLS